MTDISVADTVARLRRCNEIAIALMSPSQTAFCLSWLQTRVKIGCRAQASPAHPKAEGGSQLPAYYHLCGEAHVNEPGDPEDQR